MNRKVENMQKRRFRALCSQIDFCAIFYALTLFSKKTRFLFWISKKDKNKCPKMKRGNTFAKNGDFLLYALKMFFGILF